MHHFDELGLSIEVPQNWHVQSSTWLDISRRRHFEQSTLSAATLPVLCVTKYQDTVGAVNPTLQVVFRPSPEPGLDAPEVLEYILPPIVAMLGADVLEYPTPCRIDCALVARCRVSHSLQVGDTGLDVLTRFWLVARGTHLIILSGAGPPSGRDVCEDEFARAIESVILTTPRWNFRPSESDRRSGRSR